MGEPQESWFKNNSGDVLAGVAGAVLLIMMVGLMMLVYVSTTGDIKNWDSAKEVIRICVLICVTQKLHVP